MITPNSKIKTIAIFRALQLGDLMCAIPAIRALRQKYPKAQITLIGLPSSKALTKRYHKYFDAFIPFPGYPGLPEQNFSPEQYRLFVGYIQRLSFDLILQMQGNGTIVNDMIRTFGARYIAGYCPEPGTVRPNEIFMQYPNYGHEVNRHLLLLSFLGAPSVDTALEFPLTTQDELDFKKINLPVQPKKYVCIHAGSRGTWRQWPPLYFAALGDYCVKMGYAVVLTGTEEELPIVKNVAELMKEKSIIAAGRTSMGAVGILIDQSFALISNCTGVSHIAAALKTQSVVISMDGEPERWAPINQLLHRTIDWTKTPNYDLVFKEVAALFFRL